MALTEQEMSDLGIVQVGATQGVPTFEELGIKQISNAPSVDPATLETLKATGSTDQEAIRRARNIASMQEGAASAKQAKNEFNDIGSQIGTFAESAIGTATYGILPYLEGLAGDVLAEDAGLIDNPFTSENIVRRREENPSSEKLGMAAGIVASVGSGLIRKGGEKLIEKGAELIAKGGLSKAAGLGVVKPVGFATQATGAALDLINIPGQIGGAIAENLGARAGARLVESTLAKETSLASQFLKKAEVVNPFAEIQALKPLETLNTADLAIANAARAAAAGPKSGFDLLKNLVSSKSADEQLTAKSIDWLTKESIKAKLKAQASAVGWGGKALIVGSQAATGAIGHAVGGASIGAISNVAARALERNALSPEEVEGYGDVLTSDILRGAAPGALLGGSLGAAVPLVGKGLEAGIQLSKDAFGKITKLVLPQFGRLSGVPPKDLRAAVELTTASTQKSFGKEVTKFARAVQFQHDNIDSYTQSIKNVNKDFIDDLVATGKIPAGTKINLFDEPLLAEVRSSTAALRQKFMYKNAAGEYKVDEGKLKNALLSTKIERKSSFTGDEEGYLIGIPQELEDFNSAINQLSENPKAAIFKKTGEALSDTKGYKALSKDLTERNISPTGLPSFPGSRGVEGGQRPFILPEQEAYPLFNLRMDNLSYDSSELASMAKVAREKVQLSEVPRNLLETGFSGWLVDQLTGLGLGTSFATVYAAKLAYRMSTNPSAVIENYGQLQRAATGMRDVVADFSNKLTYSQKGKIALTRAVLPEVQDADTFLPSDKKYHAEFLKDEALALYNADKELFSSIVTEAGVNSIADLYSEDMAKLDVSYPLYANRIANGLPKGISYLSKQMQAYCKAPAGWNTALQGSYTPTRKQLYEYSAYSKYVRNPLVIFKDIEKKKYIPDAAIDVLTNVYPGLYSTIQMQILQDMMNARAAGEVILPAQYKMAEKLLGQKSGALSLEQMSLLQRDLGSSSQPKSGNVPTGNNRVKLERQGTTAE